MLTVVWSVLRVIGLILLILLGVLLGLILLILFMPIVYRVQAEKAEGSGLNVDGLTASARARWFFGLLRASFSYPEPGNLVVKVLFFTVYDSGKEIKGDESIDDDSLTDAFAETSDNTAEETGGEGAEQTVTVDAGSPKTPETTDFKDPQNDTPQTSQAEPEDWTNHERVREHEAAWEELRSKLRGEKPESKIDKIMYTFRSTCDKIHDIRDNISYYKNILEDEPTKKLFHHLLLRLGRILKNIRPRKLQADIRFGTGAPDTTGYLFGIYGMFAHCFGNHFILTPDFEQAALEGRFYARGHIMLVQVLWHGLMLVLDKKLWDFIDRVKHRED